MLSAQTLFPFITAVIQHTPSQIRPQGQNSGMRKWERSC